MIKIFSIFYILSNAPIDVAIGAFVFFSITDLFIAFVEYYYTAYCEA